jgi:hypothetical protein
MVEDKIILRSVYKVTRCFMEPAKHPQSKRFADCVRPCDEHGKIILTEKERSDGGVYISQEEVIELFDGKVFDMSNPYETAWWNAIRYSKKIAQDRWERDKNGALIVDGNAKRYGTAEFYVERPGVETKLKNNKKRDIHEAKTYIYGDTDEGRRQKVRLLGNSMPGLPDSDVEDYLVSIAERTPHIISELYTGTDTHLRLFLLDAMDKYVIYNRDKLYYYGESIVLGATDTAVLAFFKNPDNKRIVDMIKAEVYPDFMKQNSKPIDTLNSEDIEQKVVRKAK